MSTGIFSTYGTGENRVTASILAVLRSLSMERTERILRVLVQDSDFSLVRFEDQPAAGAQGVPDAGITASCHVLVETKIKPNAVDREQLKRHLGRLQKAAERTRIVLVLTPDSAEPPALGDLNDDRLVWSSFEQLDGAIDDLLEDASEVVSEREAFLLRELQAMLKQEGLIGPATDTVVIPARRGWPQYLRLHAYICQTRRSFLPVKHVAFYTANSIQAYVPFVEACHEQVVLEPEVHSGRLREVIEGLLAEAPQLRGGELKVFLLSGPDDPRTIRLEAPIENDVRSRSGRRVAFVQNQRYVNSEKLLKARTTSELLGDHP